MNWLRRALLELWGMAVLAITVGYLGPFGSYIGNPLVYRVQAWGGLLFGAYLFVRPLIWVSDWLAQRISLPRNPLALWGSAAMAVPLAMIWRAIGQDAFRALDGYAMLLPFALLSSLAVLGVTRWAQRTSERLTNRLAPTNNAAPPTEDRSTAEAPPGEPRILARLSPGFHQPIIALQSEDHYVRVHGPVGSELHLMRLRDAIAEMEGVRGEQIHRSWWVAHEGIKGLVKTGRTWSLRLANGELAPVARDSLERLRQSGFLRNVIENSG